MNNNGRLAARLKLAEFRQNRSSISRAIDTQYDRNLGGISRVDDRISSLLYDKSMADDIDQTFDEQQQADNSKSIFDSIGEGLKDFGTEVKNTLFGTADNSELWESNSDLSSTYNETIKISIRDRVGGAEGALELSKKDQDDLDQVLTYLNNVQKLKDSLKQTNGLIVNDSQKQLYDNISQFEEYAKTEGKKSSVIRTLLFDTNKASAWDNIKALWNNSLGYKYHTDFSKIEKNPTNILNWLDYGMLHVEGFAEGIGEIFQTGTDAIDAILPEKILGYKFSKKAGSNIRRDIERKDVNDREYDKLFTGHQDLIDNSQKLLKLNDETNFWKKYQDRDRIEKEQKLKDEQNKFVRGTWYYDPNKIDPNYEKLQNDSRLGLLGSVLHPTYAIPEIGSSWSSIEEMGIAMAGDNIARLAASKLSSIAMRNNPLGKVLSIGEIAKTLSSADKVERAIAGANLAAKTNTAIKWSAPAAQAYLTSQMRIKESLGEANGAYTQRTLDEAMKKGVDLKLVFDEVDSRCDAAGIARGGNEQKKISLALALGVYGNKEFNEIAKESRKGLNKVYNDNNTLAFMDYAEQLPFMDFSRSAIRGIGRDISDWNNIRKGDYYQLGANKLKRAANEEAEKAVRGIVDRQIQRVADKFFTKAGNKVAAYHGLEFVKRKLGKALPLMGKEGLEEGQQQLLLTRYQRGDYDNYTDEASLFNIPSFLRNQNIAMQAVGDYLGINFGDPDNGDEELKRAMEIGAVTSLFFGAPQVLSNLTRSSNPANRADNTRNLVHQMKNDKFLNRIVTENYGKAQDDAHVGMYFDFLNSGKSDISEINNAFDDFKKFKGELVTDDYIDNDKKLFNTAAYAYNSPVIKDLMKQSFDSENGSVHPEIKQGSEEHKALVKLATQAILDNETATDAVDNSIKLIDKLKSNILNQLDEGVYEKDPILKGMVDKIKSQYGAHVKHVDSNLVSEIGEDSMNFTKEEWDAKVKEKAGTLDEYVRKKIENIFTIRELENARQIKQSLEDQQKRYKLISEETGTDMDTTRLGYMIDFINDFINERETAYKNNSLNKIILLYNKEHPDDQKQEVTTEDLYSLYGKFANQDEIDKVQLALIMNSALQSTTQPIALMYVTGGINPELAAKIAHKISWDSISDMQKTLFMNAKGIDRTDIEAGRKAWDVAQDNKIAELQKLARESKLRKESDEQELTLDEAKNIQYAQQAARSIIDENIANKIERQRVAHKEWEKDQVPNSDTVEAAENGDIDAQDKINDSESIDTPEDVQDISDELADILAANDTTSADEVLDQESVREKKRQKDIQEKTKELKEKDIQNDDDSVDGADIETRPEDAVEDDTFESTSDSMNDMDDSASVDSVDDALDISLFVNNQDENIELGEGEFIIDDPYIISLLENEDYPTLDLWNSEEDANKMDELDSVIPTRSYISYLFKDKEGNVFYQTILEDKNTTESIHIYNVEAISVRKVGNKYIGYYDGLGEEGFNVSPEYQLEYTSVPEEEEYENEGSTLMLRDDDPSSLTIIFGFKYDSNGPTGLYNIYRKQGIDQPSSDTETPITPDAGINVDTGTNDADKADSSVDDNEPDSRDELDDNHEGDDNNPQNLDDTPANDGKDPIDSMNDEEDTKDNSLSVNDDYSLSMNDAQDLEPQSLNVNDRDLEQENQSLDAADHGEFDQNDQVEGVRQFAVRTSEQANRDYLGATCFYQPQGDIPINLAVNGQKLTTKYNVQPGRELAQKLLDPKWLPSCKCYYVVSGNQKNMKGEKDLQNPDCLTVSLVIDDDYEKKTYITTYKTPGAYTYTKADGTLSKSHDGESEIRKQLRLCGMTKEYKDSVAKIEENRLNKKSPEYDNPVFVDWKIRVGEAVSSRYAYATGKYFPRRSKFSTEEEYDAAVKAFDEAAYSWYTALPKDNPLKNKIDDDLRMNESLGFREHGKTPLTHKEIDAAILNLKDQRNSVIDAYCTKDSNGNIVIPTEIRTDVIPETVNQSHGRFNNQKDEVGNAQFRSLTEGGFDLDDDIESISSKINNAEVFFGVGHGRNPLMPVQYKGMISDVMAQGEAIDIPGNVNKVLGEDESGQAIIMNGLSGKIYAYVTTGYNEDGPMRTPVMLSELRFNKQDGGYVHPDIRNQEGKVVRKGNLKLAINPDGSLKDGVKPSVAEVILMATIGVPIEDEDYKALHDPNKGRESDFFDLVIHQTKDPIKYLKHLNVRNKYWWMTDKVFAFQNNVLYIGELEGDLHKIGQYTREDILADEDLRRKIIYNIAEHMHWNTPVRKNEERGEGNTVVSEDITMADDMPENILQAIYRCFDNHPGEKTISVLGCEELTFNRDDFFEEDTSKLEIDPLTGEKHHPVRQKKFNILSWMIKNKKLVTNLGQQPFVDPFVFASGVKQNASERRLYTIKKEAESVDNTKPGTSIMDAAALEAAAVEAVAEAGLDDYIKGITDKVSWFESKYNPKLRFLRTAETRKLMQDGFFAERGKEISDLIILNVELLSSDVKEDIKKKVDEYVAWTNKHNDPNIPKITKVEYLNKFKQIRKIDNSHIPYIIVEKNGTAIVGWDLRSKLAGTDVFSKYITGVYETQKTKGRLDQDEATEWLTKTLGIPVSHIAVLASLKTASGEKAYGVTRMFTKVIDDAVDRHPTITLSMEAGKGVHYHEAWHYVNLLLHSRQQRLKAYQDYIKQHPELKNEKLKVIEEHMADDFREYMEFNMDNSFSGRVKRLFKNIWDFVRIWKKPDVTRLLFNDIRKGKYAKVKTNDESVNEFVKRYPEGVYSADMYIPTVNSTLLENLHSISSYAEFYSVGVNIAHALISQCNIRTIEDLKTAAASFNDFIEDLRSTSGKDYNVEDVLNNIDAFKAIIAGEFEQLGIDCKWHEDKLKVKGKTKQKELDHNASDRENRNDFTYDIMDLSVSKKDNVMFRAKLFLKQIPLYKWNEFHEAEPVLNSILTDISEYWSFDEAWNKVLSNLWNCESYADMDLNGYKSTSIRGTVERLASIDPFFYALNERLLDIEGDTQLETLIFGTVKSSKPLIAYTRLQDPKRYAAYEDTGDIDYKAPDPNAPVGDIKRIISIQDDNSINVVRNLQRAWSLTVMLTPSIHYDGQNNIVTVDYDYFKQNIKNPFDKLRISIGVKGRLITRFARASEDSLKEKCQLAEQELVRILQLMGIPADVNVIDRMLANRLSNPKDILFITTKMAALQDLLAQNNRGSIYQTIVNFNSAGKNSKTKIGKKEITDVYTGTPMDSELSQLAKAYNELYPQSSEFSVQAPDGSTIYPISQNNFMSDRIRQLNNNNDGMVESLRRSPYAKNSLLLKKAEELHKNADTLTGEDRFILDAFVGMRDDRTKEGNDYMKISPMDDYLSKLAMTRKDLVVLPTMADKKTWYAIKSKVKLVHDTILMLTVGDKEGLKFSESTIDIFSGYMVDEFNSLIQYYNRDNLEYSVQNPQWTYKNFHGKTMRGKQLLAHMIKCLPVNRQQKLATQFKYKDVKSFIKALDNYDVYVEVMKSLPQGVKDYVSTNKMTWGGNGGMFRYMYDVVTINRKQPIYDGEHNIVGHNTIEINLNQYLEYVYKQQIMSMFDPVGTGGYLKFREGDKDIDGFENIRKVLGVIRDLYFTKTPTGYVPNSKLRHNINNKLIRLTVRELQRLSSDPNINFVIKNPDALTFNNVAIPQHMYNETEKAIKDSVEGYNPSNNDVTFTIIANHVASSAISVIELEKVFAGDPAYYKTANQSDEICVSIKDKDGQPDELDNIISLTQIRQKADDKIKRLGALLSPGANLRLSYDEDTILAHPDPVTGKYTLRGTKYTNLNVTDITAKSQFLDTIRIAFGRQLYVDYMRQHPEEAEVIMANYGFKRMEAFFNELYLHEDKYKEILEASSQSVKDYVEKGVSQQSSPYDYDPSKGNDGITVSDAQVCIRPALYRKIRISLGQWSFDEDDSGYSDEKAYELLETDGSWMTDSEKAKIVAKLQLFPLKMTYFTNDNRVMYGSTGDTLNLPIYNKMAIFPMFKYATLSGTGLELYKRMNRPGLELDMVTFESAVKVGLNQGTHTPYKKGTTDLSEFDNSFDLPSDWSLDDYGNPIKDNDEGDHLAVQIQDLDGLRLQLNTEAHTDEERAIGTQMFKIAFSNIIDDALYGLNQGEDKCRTGSQLKREIMSCINAMTHQGIQRAMDNYGTDAKVHQKMLKIVKSNGLGVSAQALIEDGAKVASIVTRKVFEQGISSAVNKEVVDINTKGGSAIQLSVFGFVGYGKKNVTTQDISDDKYHVLNEGKELKWYKKDGTMEIMLSMNFFRQVLPKNLKFAPYAQQREWLVEHDIIQGTKKDGSKSNPKPFGVGYRIPTQGMSSMFAFTVADVLPTNSGDNIIVPREFTAQTGSDFDVDKLFLATMSYLNGKLEELKNVPENIDEMTSEERLNYFVKQPSGAVSNRLLHNYMTIISDVRNIANARASIDTITDIVKKEILPLVKEALVGYLNGMEELLPSFQSRKKMEFSVGKTGIGPFALNITNLSLTLYTHLTMDFSKIGDYKLGPLDAIIGEDGNRISDWLSALVNAHVDVAKDPYVFDINVNSCTYNMANLLLRCGKGKKTFLFLAQPALKLFANKVNSMNGMYGLNLLKPANDSAEYENMVEKVRLLYEKTAIIQLSNKIKELENLAKNGENEQIRNDAQSQLNKYGKRAAQLISKNGKKHYEDTFNEKILEEALKNPNSLCAVYVNLLSLKSFKRINPYAQELSKLVKYSKIDTKKFGNNIASHINWRNSYEQFKFGPHKVRWYINDGKYDPKLDEDPTSSSLQKYFHNMFLDDKFFTATRLCRRFLRKEVFTATPLFDDIFNIVMSLIHGTNIVTAPSGEQVPYYDNVSDDDHVQSIADAIDTMMRFSAIKNNPNFAIDLSDMEYDSECGPIDFTFGGDMYAVQGKIHDLVFGNNIEPSIIDRLSIFTNELRTQHTNDENLDIDEISEGLLTDDGFGIANDLLLYLQPRPADDKFPSGRLTLSKPRGYTDPYITKGKLIASFDQLLRHPSEYVRKLARDLAFYAYYSTYDTNTANSFFELVPPYYRSQIDVAFKDVLNYSQNDSSTTQIATGKEDSYDNFYLDSILGIERNGNDKYITGDFIDTLFRNYYYDDKIVNRFYIEKQPVYDDDLDSGESNEKRKSKDKYLVTKSIKINGRNARFPGIIESHRANSSYIKITTNGITQLYKKIGVSYEEVEDQMKNGDVLIKLKYVKSVYVIIPKLGLHQGKNHQYEFVGGNDVASIYSENELPESMTIDKLREAYGTHIQKTERMFIPLASVQIQTKYRQDVNIHAYRESYFNQKENVRFDHLNKKNITPSEECDNQADVSLSIDKLDNPENIASKIAEAIQDKSYGYSFHFSGNPEIRVSQEEIDNFINNQVEQFKSRYLRLNASENITQDDLENAAENYKEELSKEATNMLKQQKLNKFMSDLYTAIKSTGVRLTTVYSTGEHGIEEASVKAFMANTDKFERPHAYVVTKMKLNSSEFDRFSETFNVEEEIKFSQDEMDDVDNRNDLLIYINDQTSDDVERDEARKGEVTDTIDDFDDALNILGMDGMMENDGKVTISAEDFLQQNVDDEFDDNDEITCAKKTKK